MESLRPQDPGTATPSFARSALLVVAGLIAAVCLFLFGLWFARLGSTEVSVESPAPLAAEVVDDDAQGLNDEVEAEPASVEPVPSGDDPADVPEEAPHDGRPDSIEEFHQHLDERFADLEFDLEELFGNLFSEDLFSEDLFSEDLFSEDFDPFELLDPELKSDLDKFFADLEPGELPRDLEPGDLPGLDGFDPSELFDPEFQAELDKFFADGFDPSELFDPEAQAELDKFFADGFDSSELFDPEFQAELDRFFADGFDPSELLDPEFGADLDKFFAGEFGADLDKFFAGEFSFGDSTLDEFFSEDFDLSEWFEKFFGQSFDA